MIEWSKVAPALIDLFTALAVYPARDKFVANWAEKRNGFVDSVSQAELTIKVTSVVGVGNDESRLAYVTTPQVGVQETIVGHRKFMLEVRVESFAHDEDTERWSWSMIERIRTRLRRQHSQDALRAVNVAMLRAGPAIDASFTLDKRRVNAAVMDVEFYAAFVDADPVVLGWFDKVKLTEKIRGADDVLLPSPPNFTDLLIPET